MLDGCVPDSHPRNSGTPARHGTPCLGVPGERAKQAAFVTRLALWSTARRPEYWLVKKMAVGDASAGAGAGPEKGYPQSTKAEPHLC